MATTDAERLRMLQADLEEATRERDRQSDPKNKQILQQTIDGIGRDMQRLRMNPSPETYAGGPGSAAPSAAPASSPSLGSRAAIAAKTINGQDIGDFVGGILQTGMDAQQTYIKQQQDAVATAANAQAATTLAKADREQKIDDNAQQMQKAAGLDPTDTDNMYYKALAALQVNDAKYADARKEYDQYAQASLFNDPLTWIMGQLGEMNAAAAKVNAIADQSDMITGQLTRSMSLFDTARKTTQVNIDEDDRRIADFQAREQIAKGTATLAEIGAVGARANMMAAAMIGENARKDQKTEAQRLMDEYQQQKAQEALEQMRRTREEQNNLTELTGSPVSATTLTRLKPDDRAALEGFQQTKTASPTIIRKYGTGLQKTAPATYNTAVNLDTEVQKLADDFAARRASGNPKLMAGIPKLAKDDEKEAWEQLKAKFENANQSRGGTGIPAFPMNSSTWDATPNPLKIQNNAFITFMDKVGATGQPVPVPPGNIMVQMFKRMSNIPGTKIDATGEIKGRQEQQVLGAVSELFNSGAMKDANGKPLSPEAYAAMITQYYRAADSWNFKRQGLKTFGFQPQQKYLITVPIHTGLSGAAGQQIIDAKNPAEVLNWLTKEKKNYATQREINQNMQNNPYFGL